mmetsp:Transcript_9876/g.18624  ORF Transcript_9876/g.18624 Transcript_9876/m.18624 type:complete len:229 (+) Transcript_9876:628-1314(+)
MIMDLPSSQYRFSSPTLIQHSPSGIINPRCPVSTKLVLSVCGLIPVWAVCDAKKISEDGTLKSFKSLVVLGKSLVWASSQRPRSCSTRVRHSGPYARASPRTAELHSVDFASGCTLGLSARLAASSSRTTSHLSSNFTAHSYPSWCGSCQGVADKPSMYDDASCLPRPGQVASSSRPALVARSESITLVMAPSPNSLDSPFSMRCSRDGWFASAAVALSLAPRTAGVR